MLASVRAGNVIGGGDPAADRLVPDLVRAFETGVAPLIRAPQSVRPWQHVLEALSGYVAIAERLLAGERRFADASNFGPGDEDARSIGWIVERVRGAWRDGAMPPAADAGAKPHEAGLLRLDSARARAALGWRPVLTLGETIDWIVDWHKAVGKVARGGGEDARRTTLGQIAHYAALAVGMEAAAA